MKWIQLCLPKTDRLALRTALLILMLGFVYVGCNWIYDGILSGQWFFLSVGAFLIILAAGLRFMQPWARTASVLALWLFVIVLQLAMVPIGAGALDAIAEERMPSAIEMAMKVYPRIIAVLLLLHILGKYKAEFKKQ
ncbi:MAG TPA: hypothetical protein VFF26_09675 [Gallionella sp.]|nr:hypothetical protein [Gallionella sp.]